MWENSEVIFNKKKWQQNRKLVSETFERGFYSVDSTDKPEQDSSDTKQKEGTDSEMSSKESNRKKLSPIDEQSEKQKRGTGSTDTTNGDSKRLSSESDTTKVKFDEDSIEAEDGKKKSNQSGLINAILSMKADQITKEASDLFTKDENGTAVMWGMIGMLTATNLALAYMLVRK